MLGDRTGEDRPQRASELAHVGAAVVPERATVGHLREREHLFDAPVAVRGNDENASGQPRSGGLGEPEHDVVMKLALSPVGDEVVAAKAPLHRGEQTAENQAPGEGFHLIVHRLSVTAAPVRGQSRPASVHRGRPSDDIDPGKP